MKQFIIFGAGHDGNECLENIRKNNKEGVAFFCDNDLNKHGKVINGIKVISFVELLDIYKNYFLIVAVSNKKEIIE